MGALQNPINDAQAIDSQLKRLGFKTTLVKNANKIKMLEAIDDFSNQIAVATPSRIDFLYHVFGFLIAVP